MEPHFLLTFGTTSARTRTLRINNANTSVNDVSMRGAMNAIIASQAVAGASGRLDYMRRATLVETTVTPILLS